ncbi:MAG: hypothetical protein ACYCYO_17890 [Bacilli bacterium]
MGKLRKFPLNYDEDYDADIHRLIISTPLRRRSERLRQLIREGLRASKSEESPAESAKVSETNPTASQNGTHPRNVDYTP